MPFPSRFFFLIETVSEGASGALTGHTTKAALKDQIYCGIFHQSPLIYLASETKKEKILEFLNLGCCDDLLENQNKYRDST